MPVPAACPSIGNTWLPEILPRGEILSVCRILPPCSSSVGFQVKYPRLTTRKLFLICIYLLLSLEKLVV